MSSVVVIITCYNEGPYIGEAVRSVIEQSCAYRIDEIIIADDGSGEETLAVLRDLRTWDDRIRILESKGGAGPSGQRCKAIAASASDYIAILDGDDFWTPDKLEKEIGILDEDPAIGLVYSDFFGFPDRDVSAARRGGVRDITGASDLQREYFLNDPPVIPSTTLMRRSAYEASGGFDLAISVFEDSEFYFRLAGVARFALVNEPLLYKRSHKRSITGGRTDLMAHHAFVAVKLATTNPKMMPLVPRRLAERARKLANQRFLLGDNAQARALSDLALRLRWSDPAIWSAYLLARAPEGVARMLRRGLFACRISAITQGLQD